MPSEFRQACEKLMADEPTPSSISYAEAGPRSAEAWDYVRRRLLAGDLGLRQFTERGAGEIGKYLFERACACLRAGEEPHVSDADVEQYIVEQEAWCLKRYGPVEKYSTPVGSLGQTAKGIVDRLRPTTAYVDQAVIERAKNIEPPDEELDP